MGLIFLSACSEKKVEPKGEEFEEIWEFTRLVNANLDGTGNMETLDFYQKKGDQWRIVQMVPDDHTRFYLDAIRTPRSFELPVKEPDAFMTVNVQLFDPKTNAVHYPNNMKWLPKAPVTFNAYVDFTTAFKAMPAAYVTVDKISAATYSYEHVYDNRPKNGTYIFYDFANQKYVYYGNRDSTPLILQNELKNICPTCDQIDWKAIDAVTCTDEAANPSIYYFFDFDAQKMYILNRINKNTNNPSLVFNLAPIDFKNAFFEKFGSNNGNEAPFDFKK